MTAATPTITGPARVGSTLTAVSGAWAPAGVRLEYQWLSNGKVIGKANQKTYTPTAANLGQLLTVTVTGTFSGYATESRTSSPVTVLAGELAPVTPTISGTSKIGATLTAVPGTWKPAGVKFTYQWLRDNTPISGATSKTYVPARGDVGKRIAVTVTGTLPGYSNAARSSAPTVPIEWKATIDRRGGSDRYETAVKVSRDGYPGTAPVVFIATGQDYPDALSAAPAAAEKGGPLLLTLTKKLPANVKAEIKRLAPKQILIAGGPAVVSPAVEKELKTLAKTTRLGGIDRYETSEKVNKFAFTHGATTAYVATGRDYPDALSASAAAGAVDAPVVLVDGRTKGLTADVKKQLRGMGVNKVLIAGGTAIVSAGIEKDLRAFAKTKRYAGNDRFETSRMIGADAVPNAKRVFLATALEFPDALAGAALAGASNAPLFVVHPKCVPANTMAAIADISPPRITLLGGPGALTTDVAELKTCK